MPDPYLRTKTHRKKNGEVVTYEYWESEFEDRDGRRRKVSLGNKEVVKTLQAARRVRDEKIADNKPPVASSITVDEWCQIRISKLNLSPDTIAQYKNAHRRAVELWGTRKKLRSVTPHDVENLANFIRNNRSGKGEKDVPLSVWRVRNLLVSLSAMFAKAMVFPTADKPYIRTNPFEEIIPNPKGGKKNRYVTVEETKRLLEVCPDANIRAFIALMRFCGLREDEAEHVEVGHINWELRELFVPLRPERRGRGAGTKQKERTVELLPIAYKLLFERYEQLEEGAVRLVDRKPLYGEMGLKPAEYVRRLQHKARIFGVIKPCHNLRLSFSTDAVMLANSRKAADWCGHGQSVAEKHYRAEGGHERGMLNGLVNPVEKLRKDLAHLEKALSGSNA